MPKTLPAALTTAMDSGVYDPYLKVRLIVDDPETYTLTDVLSFKITDITAECVIPYSVSYLANSYFAIERGVMVAGSPVTIRTIYYVITSMVAGPKGITLQGHVLPPSFSSFDGCIWYMDVIDKLVGSLGWAMDQTVTYENPAAAWLSYLFYPAGRNLTLANMQSFFNVLAQKYMIYPAENINGLFIFQATTAKAKDYDVTDELLHHETVTTARRLMWRDQFMTIHYSGSSNNPIHNLGYIDGIQGAVPTNTASPKPFKSSKLPVHLKYRTGDVVKLGTATNYYQGRVKVTEIFDQKSNPSWHCILEPLCWYNNTEGGAMPSTIEAAAPYTPLHTGYFNGVLSSGDNNIQAAMETIDDHAHAAAYAPIAEGVTNGDTHDHAGGDGAQIDHANLATIGTNTHTQIDTHIANLKGHFWLPFATKVFSPLTGTNWPFGIAVDRTINFVKWAQSFYVETTNDGSNYWTISLYTEAVGVIESFTTKDGSRGANLWYLNIMTSFSVGTAGTGDVAISVYVTKTGAPGNLHLYAPLLEITA